MPDPATMALITTLLGMGYNKLKGDNTAYGFEPPEFRQQQQQQQPMTLPHLRQLMGQTSLPAMPLANKPSIMKALGGYQ